jgi:hypothetical protein
MNQFFLSLAYFVPKLSLNNLLCTIADFSLHQYIFENRRIEWSVDVKLSTLSSWLIKMVHKAHVSTYEKTSIGTSTL